MLVNGAPVDAYIIIGCSVPSHHPNQRLIYCKLIAYLKYWSKIHHWCEKIIGGNLFGNVVWEMSPFCTILNGSTHPCGQCHDDRSAFRNTGLLTLLWGESPCNWYIPLTKGQVCGAFIFPEELAWKVVWIIEWVSGDPRLRRHDAQMTSR